MELLLNLVWLALALAMTGLWWARWRPAVRGRARLVSAVALCCFLALMFYVISMTDDLHDEIVFAEEATSVRQSVHAVKLAASGVDPIPHGVPAAELGEATPHAAAPVLTGCAEEQSIRPVREAKCALITPRAPPQYL